MHLWLASHDARVRSLQSKGKLEYGYNRTPFGGCFVITSGEYLLGLYFAEELDIGITAMGEKWPASTLCRTRQADQMIPLLLDHPEAVRFMAIGTPFQLTVWEFLCRIPKGMTMTYGEVAASIGRPSAARAVGQAVGSNEISLLIPCHRVVSHGKLTGYRWGLERKRALLAWEFSQRDPLQMPF